MTYGVPAFDPKWTARAIRILRNVDGNVAQARGEYGSVAEGEACATQVLIDLLDDLRHKEHSEALQLISQWLPVSFDQIIEWNDDEELTFGEIADLIADKAGLD